MSVGSRVRAGLSWEATDRWRDFGILVSAALVLLVGFAVFGLPPVDVHGPLHYIGIMDPLCGMTRGTVAVLRGHLHLAWDYNPASPLVVLAMVALTGRLALGSATGRWLAADVHRPRRRTLVLLAALTALLWLNQQHHAAFLEVARRT